MPLSIGNPEASLGSLPEEIIRLILLEVRIYREFYPSFPWRFAAINKRWRAVTILFPLLWRKVELASHKCRMIRGICVEQLSVGKCALGVQRSSPLSFDADCSTIPCPDEEEELCKASISGLRVIALQCHRLRSLNINMHVVSAELWRSLLPRRDRYPALEQLTVHCSENNSYDLNFPGDTSSMTSLRAVNLTLWSGVLSMSTSLPWAQLTSVHLEHFLGYQIDILNFLSECHSLQSFLMTGRLMQAGLGLDEDDLEVINLSQLDCLGFELIDDEATTPVDIFPWITAPKLSSLLLSVADLDEECFSIIAQFILRSGCQLHTLQVPCNVEARFIEPLLRASPSMQELQLLAAVPDWDEQEAVPEGCDSHLEMLIRSDDIPTLVPSLRILTIMDLQFDPILLGEVVKSRNIPDDTGSAVSAVERVQLCCGYDADTGVSLSIAYASTLQTVLNELTMVPCKVIVP